VARLGTAVCLLDYTVVDIFFDNLQIMSKKCKIDSVNSQFNPKWESTYLLAMNSAVSL